eukprot:Tbor_TRINITY_DN5120_c0_g1::TRINITY_DN5120_c0_g1_i1::g.26161::m.26161
MRTCGIFTVCPRIVRCSVPYDASPFIGAILQSQQVRGVGGMGISATKSLNMQAGRSVQNAMNIDNMNYNSRRSDYDFDKEKWSKQMQFASLDCIMDTSITPYSYFSIEGIRKNFRAYLNMKKLRERRPDFRQDDLKELYHFYKNVSNSNNPDDIQTLMRITSHTEASRLGKIIQNRVAAEFKLKSWKSLKMRPTVGTISSKKSGHVKHQTNAANEAVNIAASKESCKHYNMIIVSFSMVHCYMAALASEDWLQIMYKVEYYERDSNTMSDAEKKKDEELTKLKDIRDAAISEEGTEKTISEGDRQEGKDLEAAGYRKVTEYPVFEVRMGDGVNVTGLFPFTVVGVLKKDGTRYGRDAQDASTLRKQFDRSKWF